MSPSVFMMVVVATGFPRVSGDEPVTADMLTPSVEFSPRERG